MTDEALGDTQRAFDGVASTYDRSNAANRTLSDMRLAALLIEEHLRQIEVRKAVR